MDPRNLKTFKLLCPHCEQLIAADLSLINVRIHANSPDDNSDWWRDGLTDEQLQLVETARTTGMLQSFSDVVMRRGIPDQPRSMERFLVTFFKTMKQSVVPSFVLQHYLREFGRDRTVTFWSAQGIFAVVHDGKIRAFAPISAIKGDSIRSISGGHSARIGGSPDVFDEWVRTRYGYVPANTTIFLERMRVKSIGQFAKPNISKNE